MKTLRITISSVEPNTDSMCVFCSTELHENLTLQLLQHLTPYCIKVEEVNNWYEQITKSLEETCQWLLNTKLQKTIAINKTVIENKTLGIFPEKPQIDIKTWEKKWHGISTGEYRSYIKNMSAKRWNIMFPTVETFHCECNKIWCEGKLTLELADDNLYYLKIERKIQTVIYETITLEK